MKKTAIAMIAFAAALSASPIYSTEATITGENGASTGGSFISPYYVQLGSSTFNFYCDDFLDNLSTGQTWMANVFSGTSLAGTYFAQSDPNYVADYAKIFWLVGQDVAGLADPIAAQVAVWDIEDPGYPSTAASAALLAQATINGPSVNLADFEVVDGINPTDPDRPQEGVIRLVKSSVIQETPEPATMSLIGSGMIFIGWKLKRRKERAA